MSDHKPECGKQKILDEIMKEIELLRCVNPKQLHHECWAEYNEVVSIIDRMRGKSNDPCC